MSNTMPQSAKPNRRAKFVLGGVVVATALVVGFVFLRSQAATVVLGDMNGDGKVTQEDVTAISKNINKNDPTAADGDLDGDGDIDIIDISLATKKIEQ